MLSYYGLEDKYDAMKAWYDGYRFGSTEVYCPWDVINYVDKLQVKRNLAPQNYCPIPAETTLPGILSKKWGTVLRKASWKR